MRNDKLILCLFGSLILSACVSNPLSSSDDDGISAIKMASHAKCMDEIETNPRWIMGSKLLSEDQKQKKKREVCNCVGDNSPKVLSKEQLALAAIDPKAKATYGALAATKTTAICASEMLNKANKLLSFRMAVDQPFFMRVENANCRCR